MQTARRRRTFIATAISAAVHLVVLTIVAMQAPMLRLPPDISGPPEAIIPILILPRTPPAAANARPAPIRLHRRPQRNLPPEPPVEPLPAPALTPSVATPRASAPVAIHPAPMPEGPKGDVKAALRHSTVGCANALAVGLNRGEHDLCDEKLGKGAKDAPFAGLGVAADKAKSLDAAAALKETCRTYHATTSGPQPRLRDGVC